MMMSLEHRAQRCVVHAQRGEPIILVVGADELERARALVGEAPVIVATGGQTMQFLAIYAQQLNEQYGGKRRRRR
jgi:hypothetical protein